MALSLIYPNLVRWTFTNQTLFLYMRLFVGGMAFRDAWKTVEGTLKEDAQKAYVEELLKVRFNLNIITRSHRGWGSQHISGFGHRVCTERGEGFPMGMG